MKFRKRRGQTISLLLACHPLPVAAMTIALTIAAALTGRSGTECALVAATILSGQLTVGWISPGDVNFATTCVVLVCIPLSLANGTAAGIAHLAAVLSAWMYNFYFKSTVFSWLPYAVSFGLLPAFLSYGGLGPGLHGAPPTIAMTVLAAMLGVGIHFLNTLPDLVEDDETGVRHLPLRIALRIGAPRLLWISLAYTTLVSAGIVVAGLTVGVRQ
jgi:4-hydroxybenzoate polyprenyltransferase